MLKLFVVFSIVLLSLLITRLASKKDTKSKYLYFSCGMENNHQRGCFVFKGKNVQEVVSKVKDMECYGWYYDPVVPLKEISMERARELISVGAEYI